MNTSQVSPGSAKLLLDVAEMGNRGFRTHSFAKDHENRQKILELLRAKYIYNIGLTLFVTEDGLNFLTQPRA